MIVNLSEAKNNLSKLIELVYKGEKVVIAKNNQPLADLIAHKSITERKLGLLTGKLKVPENFTDEDLQINEMFYGKD
ncbi:MAG: type II toxin-antitoxin system Phd/YefM family antitoxin [Sedimentisphaeraceae bacterium JB056]